MPRNSVISESDRVPVSTVERRPAIRWPPRSMRSAELPVATTLTADLSTSIGSNLRWHKQDDMSHIR